MSEFSLEAAADGVHQQALAMASRVPGRGLALDAPCGAGALATALRGIGYQVTGVDVAVHADQQLPSANFTQADLNRGVPFPDAHFDLVLSVEGIEHLESPAAFVRELVRVLRPGGQLILSTPNVLNVASRWRFFTRGFHKHFTPDAKARLSSGHLHAVDYVLVRQFLEAAGLTIEEVATNRLLRGLRERFFGMIIRWATRGRHPFAEPLLSDELLYGQVLMVRARRPLPSHP